MAFCRVVNMCAFKTTLVICILVVLRTHGCADQSWSVDPQLVGRACQLTESLLGVPEETVKAVVRRSTELYLPTQASPGECREHSKHAMERALHADVWALNMLDASTKLISGVMDGRIQDLGNYDQCLRVREPDQLFRGKHCYINPRGILPEQADTFLKTTGMYQVFPSGTPYFSLCVPSTCSPEDVRSHLNTTLRAAGVKASTDDFLIICSTGESTPLRTKDWMALGVFVTIGLLVALSTWYDIHASGVKSELLTAFSIPLNWRGLVSTQGPAPDISCLTGLRILCAATVIFSHRMALYLYVPLFNRTNFVKLRQNPLYCVVGGADFATDVFFLISGVLRSYNFFRHRYEGRPLKITQEYVQRYFRVMPSLALAILFTSTVYIRISDGPIWQIYIGLAERVCSGLWWANLLHITNFLDPLYQCRVESWFLAADFQQHLFSPLLLIPLYYRPRLGWWLLGGLFTAATVAKFYGVFTNGVFPELFAVEGPRVNRIKSKAHMNPFIRSGGFLMGIVLGYLLFEAKFGRRKITLTKSLQWAVWSSVAVVMVVTPTLQSYMLLLREDSPWLSALFIGVLNPLRVASVAWLIFTCTMGYTTWLNRILSWPGLYPIARLSFGIYIVHLMVAAVQFLSTRTDYDFNLYDAVYLGLGDLVVCSLTAVAIHLVVEVPCLRILGSLFRGTKSPPGLLEPLVSKKNSVKTSSEQTIKMKASMKNSAKQNSTKASGKAKEKKRKNP